jgi:hypothetical protein
MIIWCCIFFIFILAHYFYDDVSVSFVGYVVSMSVFSFRFVLVDFEGQDRSSVDARVPSFALHGRNAGKQKEERAERAR